VGRPEGKRPNGRSFLGWKDNITGDLKKWHGKAWIGFIWLRIGSTGGRL
jgi:hypothetical protein